MATVRKKEEDAAMARKPTLFSYFRQKDSTQPSTSALAREADQMAIEGASRVVVSQATSLKAIPETYADQHADEDTQGEGDDVHPSADQNLDSNPNRDLDRDKPLAWSTVKVRARVGGCEPGCEPRARSKTPSTNVHETEKEDPQVTHTRQGCSEAWLLLDRLHTEIRSVRDALEDCEGNELSGYSRSAALLLCADVPQDEVWENVNPGLDRILGFGRPQREIVAMIRRSREGLQGLYEYLEVLVEQGGVVAGLLEGKVATLMMAMAE